MKQSTRKQRVLNEYLQWFRWAGKAMFPDAAEIVISDLDENNKRFSVTRYSVKEDRITFLHPEVIKSGLTGGIISSEF